MMHDHDPRSCTVCSPYGEKMRAKLAEKKVGPRAQSISVIGLLLLALAGAALCVLGLVFIIQHAAV